MPETYDYDDLEPSNIASVNVLKGAAATEKYGDKGENGVIEILTKSSNGNNSPAINAQSFSVTAEATSRDLEQIKTY